MGERSAVVELLLGDMGSMQRELRPSTQREDQLTMETNLEQIAVKAVNQLPTAEERGAGNPHATFCGSRGRATASGDPVLGGKFPGPTRQSRRFDAPPPTQNPTFWLMHCLWFSFRGHLLASAKANLLLRERGIPTARGNGKWSAVQVAGVLERL